MKLTTKDFDQATFSNARTIQSLLWIRKNKASSIEMDVSYKDMLSLYAEHKFYSLFKKLKQKYSHFRGKIRG